MAHRSLGNLVRIEYCDELAAWNGYALRACHQNRLLYSPTWIWYAGCTSCTRSALQAQLHVSALVTSRMHLETLSHAATNAQQGAVQMRALG